MEDNIDVTMDNVAASSTTSTADIDDGNLQPTEHLQQQLSGQPTSTMEIQFIENNAVIEGDIHPVKDISSEFIEIDANGAGDNHDTIPRSNETIALSLSQEPPRNDEEVSKMLRPSTVPVSMNGTGSNSTLDNVDIPKTLDNIEIPLASVSDNITPDIDHVPEVETKIDNEQITRDDDTGSDIVAALQENLQNQMNAKAEAEDKVRRMESKIQLLEEQLRKQQEEIFKFDTLQENLELQMTAKAEAEHKARSAYDRIQQLETEKDVNVQDLKRTQQQLCEARETIADKDRELDKVRYDRDEYERKVTVLTTRLNAAKKQEAVKVNHVDEVEDDLKVTSEELEQTKQELATTKAANTVLEQKLEYLEKVSKEHIKHLESALTEEQRLNEERKLKMKDYVDNKTEDLRQTKEYNDSLQIELTQTNRSFVELNNRWKQLHTQWVQAQTHNRELQRDLNRTKKDSEHLHKQGDTLEMKLSRSANETEEHKNKRLAAKQELMSVLRALEAERDVTTKLRDQIKFTFVPKMLNQQQTLNDIIQEFSTSLEKLSIRLGKPLPTLPDDTERDESKNMNTNGSYNKNPIIGDSTPNPEINPLIEKLDNESQRVSVAITAVANNVERLRALVQASGDRTCFTVLSELISTGGMESTSPALHADRPNIPNSLTSIGRSHRYGQIPGASD
jgi:chromosome segregation ATPase